MAKMLATGPGATPRMAEVLDAWVWLWRVIVVAVVLVVVRGVVDVVPDTSIGA